MKLSVVIVNYNVEHFLEQCLFAVEKAIHGIDAEVCVVDNNSVDGSLLMLTQRFSWVKVIANTENVGFSKANNQAIREAKGEYVLLLNPDTIVENDTFSKTISFLDNHQDAGGLGVTMIDGKGKFLPESKRGLPTPEVAFYKMFGLSKLFKKSKRFGKYHLTYLDKDQTHEVDILSGAFMMLRAKTLSLTGLLDEDYFMYGEDIDLSYRITQAGFKNYYFADTKIIHYKGESTKKGSLNYVFVFYNAMRIFARKHFSGNSKHLFLTLINFAIYLRATMSIIKRFAQKVWLPITDFVLIFGTMYLLKGYWEETVLSHKSSLFPAEFIQIAIPIYILVWMYSVYLTNGYRNNSKPSNIVKGVVFGTIFILVFYALMPESFRFSRAMIVLGSFGTVIVMILWRLFLNVLKFNNFSFSDDSSGRFLVVGNVEEAQRVADVLRKTNLNPEFIGLITLEKEIFPEVIGSIHQISEIISIYNIKEVVFCAKDLAANQIIEMMGKLQSHQIEYKIAPPESLSIIGSSSINTSGDIYVIQVNAITTKQNKRNKRILDVVISIMAIIISPILMWFSSPIKYYRNCFNVILSKRSWVGLHPVQKSSSLTLKPGIFYPTDGFSIKLVSDELIEKANNVYSHDYKLALDLKIVLKSITKLGR
jgi:GT2 family glycosyltransferase